jgi:pSer/pThr/pTyr-binding forkhead associated (FHA) protein
MAGLTVLPSAAQAGREVALGSEPVTIGRGKANVIVLLADPRVSLRHATVERTAEGWLLRDAGSRNGTWVNGERVGEHLLGDGDQLQLGETLLLFVDPAGQ